MTNGQTSYTRNADTAVAGMPIDSQEGVVKKSYVNPNGVIVFGTFMARVAGTGRSVQAPTTLADDIVAVAERYLAQEEANSYPINSNPAGIVRGPVWMRVEQDVTPDDAVFCDCTGATPGYARKDAGIVGQAAAIAAEVPNARFDGPSITGRDGIKIAPVYLNLN